jgi:hypothetical protein
MDNGLTIEVAEMIDNEIKVQQGNGVNLTDNVLNASIMVNEASELMYKFYAIEHNCEAVRINAIRIAAFAARVAQSLCQ